MHFENLGQSRSLKQLKNCISFFFLGVRTRGGNSNQNLEKSRAVYLTPLSSPIPRSSRVLKTSNIHEFFVFLDEYSVNILPRKNPSEKSFSQMSLQVKKSLKNSVKKSVRKICQKSCPKICHKIFKIIFLKICQFFFNSVQIV